MQKAEGGRRKTSCRMVALRRSLTAVEYQILIRTVLQFGMPGGWTAAARFATDDSQRHKEALNRKEIRKWQTISCMGTTPRSLATRKKSCLPGGDQAEPGEARWRPGRP